MSIIRGAGSKKPYSAGPSLPHTNEDTTKQPPFIYRKLEPSSIRLPIISAMEVTVELSAANPGEGHSSATKTTTGPLLCANGLEGPSENNINQLI